MIPLKIRLLSFITPLAPLILRGVSPLTWILSREVRGQPTPLTLSHQWREDYEESSINYDECGSGHIVITKIKEETRFRKSPPEFRLPFLPRTVSMAFLSHVQSR